MPELPSQPPNESSSPNSSSPDPHASMKQKVVKGGLYLTLRQLVSILMSLVSMFVIARRLGPNNYGILGGALGIFYFLTWTGRLGLNVYLIQQKTLKADAPVQVLAFHNTLNLLLAGALLVCSPLISAWMKVPEMTELIRWLPFPIAADIAAGVSIAMLERELAFAEVGLIEMAAQLANYAIALPLVFAGASYWGPVIGLSARGLIMLVIAQYFYRIAFRWRWQWSFMQPALRYGLTFSLSNWVISLRALSIPMVITPLAGPETAGLVNMAIRLTEQLSILRLVIRRMSISVMAKLTSDAAVIRKTVSQGMAFQALLIGTVCAAFSCVDSWIVPQFFGAEWITSTYIFPFIALSSMVRAMFDLHAGALYAVDRNTEVTRAYVIYITLLWLGCAALIPTFGIWGYGIAELLTVLSNFWLHRALEKIFGKPSYRVSLWLTVAAMLPIMTSLYSPVLGGIVFAVSYGLVLILPSVRQIVMSLVNVVFSKWRMKTAG